MNCHRGSEGGFRTRRAKPTSLMAVVGDTTSARRRFASACRQVLLCAHLPALVSKSGRRCNVGIVPIMQDA
jgi:hypothetical protein